MRVTHGACARLSSPRSLTPGAQDAGLTPVVSSPALVAQAMWSHGFNPRMRSASPNAPRAPGSCRTPFPQPLARRRRPGCAAHGRVSRNERTPGPSPPASRSLCRPCVPRLLRAQVRESPSALLCRAPPFSDVTMTPSAPARDAFPPRPGPVPAASPLGRGSPRHVRLSIRGHASPGSRGRFPSGPPAAAVGPVTESFRRRSQSDRSKPRGAVSCLCWERVISEETLRPLERPSRAAGPTCRVARPASHPAPHRPLIPATPTLWLLSLGRATASQAPRLEWFPSPPPHPQLCSVSPAPTAIAPI